jgi:hypothetical protein
MRGRWRQESFAGSGILLVVEDESIVRSVIVQKPFSLDALLEALQALLV